MFLYQALRDYSLWGDLWRYNYRHELFAVYRTLPEFWEEFLREAKDIGYYFVEWITVKCGLSFQMWMTVIAALFISSVCILIYRKSKDPLISILTFLALGFFEFSLSGLRQTVAMSIVIWAYYLLEKKKIARFIALIIVASLFHRSALFFLMILPMAKMKLGKWHVCIAVAGGLGFTIFRSNIKNFLAAYVLGEQYAWYANSNAKLNYMGFLIQAAIFMFCLFYYRQTVRADRNNLILYNMSFIGVLLQLYSSFIAEFFRMSMYFSLFNIILIPIALAQEKDARTRVVLRFLITSVLMLYIGLQGRMEYQVFWR